MRDLLIPFAAIGVIAILVELGRSLLRLFGSSAEAVVTSEIARTRAQRGDLTGMDDAAAQVGAARRRRRADLVRALLWGAALAAPPATPWPEEFYAGVAVVWLALRFTRGTRKKAA